MVHRHGLDTGQCGLCGRLGRAEQMREPGLPRALRRGQNAAHRPQPPVECELADRRVTAERFGRHLPRGRQHRQGDRQVEAGPFLPELGRREVDGDPPDRPLELGGGYPGPNALLRLLAGAIGQADYREARNAELEVRLDLDAACVEPDQRVRDRPCEHRRHARDRHVTRE